MSGKTWIYSDPHFYHRNIVKFTNFDGSPLRPWDDSNIMTEEMIEWYNELVDEGDRVYMLGDIAFRHSDLDRSVGRMKGRKILVKGNHDPENKLDRYMNLFDDVRSYVIKKGFIMSHIPIHPQSLSRWKLNIHGHLHNNQVMVDKEITGAVFNPEWDQEDSRYYCACVERTNFRPKLLDEILHERGLK